MVGAVLKGISEYLGEGDIPQTIGNVLLKKYIPQAVGMGYTRNPQFAFLNNQAWRDLPVISQPKSGRLKIEVHEAKQAGDHLDLRFKFNGELGSHDFAVAKKTVLPDQTGKVFKVIHRPNHSEHYYNKKSHFFEKGQYGYGQMNESWEGEIDILYSDKTKIEFSIPEGPYKGVYCLRTELSPEIPNTIMRMKEPDPRYIERWDFTDSPKAQQRAFEDPDTIALEKVDGANYYIVPGPKFNLLVSRRLSSTGQVIDQSHKSPQLRYLKFPKHLHGKRIHVETVSTRGYHETARLLNSNTERSRALQREHDSHLTFYVWDMEGPEPYGERRAQYQELCVKMPRVDNRAFGDIGDRFWIRRLTNPPLMKPVCGSDVHQQTPEDYHNELISEGYEGTVMKSPHDLYGEGSWVKMKRTENFTMVITGFNEGEGANSGSLGSLQATFPGGTGQTRVGSGFTQEQRQEIWNNQDRYMGAEIEVTGHELTPNGVVRAPRLVRFHPDNTYS